MLECEFCNKEFVFESELKRHQRSHTGKERAWGEVMWGRRAEGVGGVGGVGGGVLRESPPGRSLSLRVKCRSMSSLTQVNTERVWEGVVLVGGRACQSCSKELRGVN